MNIELKELFFLYNSISKFFVRKTLVNLRLLLRVLRIKKNKISTIS